MKLNYAFALTPFLLLLLIAFDSTGSLHTLANNQPTIDTTHNSSAREVFTGQQLFVVELSNVKDKRKGTTADIKAELRDAFKIICYHPDSTHTLVDWTMITEDNRPKAGQYLYNTAEYNQLNGIIKSAENKQKTDNQETTKKSSDKH